MDTIGNMIRDARIKSLRSQAELGWLLGMSRTSGYVSRLESGQAIPSVSCCPRLATVLGLDVARLIDQAAIEYRLAQDLKVEWRYRP